MAERILSGVTPNGINGSGITSTSIQMSEEINQTAPSGSESAGHCSNKEKREKRCKVISNRITKSKKVLVSKRKVKRFGTKTTIITGLAIKQEKLTMEEFNSLKNEGYRKAEEGNSSEGSDHEKEEESKEKSKMILEPEEEDEIKTEEDLVEIEAEIFDINDSQLGFASYALRIFSPYLSQFRHYLKMLPFQIIHFTFTMLTLLALLFCPAQFYSFTSSILFS